MPDQPVMEEKNIRKKKPCLHEALPHTEATKDLGLSREEVPGWNTAKFVSCLKGREIRGRGGEGGYCGGVQPYGYWRRTWPRYFPALSKFLGKPLQVFTITMSVCLHGPDFNLLEYEYCRDAILLVLYSCSQVAMLVIWNGSFTVMFSWIRQCCLLFIYIFIYFCEHCNATRKSVFKIEVAEVRCYTVQRDLSSLSRLVLRKPGEPRCWCTGVGRIVQTEIRTLGQNCLAICWRGITLCNDGCKLVQLLQKVELDSTPCNVARNNNKKMQVAEVPCYTAQFVCNLQVAANECNKAFNFGSSTFQSHDGMGLTFVLFSLFVHHNFKLQMARYAGTGP